MIVQVSVLQKDSHQNHEVYEAEKKYIVRLYRILKRNINKTSYCYGFVDTPQILKTFSCLYDSILEVLLW